MVEWHMKSDRKFTGGRRRTSRRSTKKLAWRGGSFAETKLSSAGSKEENVSVKGRGNSSKVQSRYVINANVFDPSTKKYSKAKISTIVQNNANRQYARRNIITKGAVIEVELNGLKHAKVTSRPGQQGTINAVVIDSIETKHKSKKSKARKEKASKEKAETKKDEEKTEKKEVHSEKKEKTSEN